MKIFVVWDQTTRAIRTTLESLSGDPPTGLTLNVPMLSPDAGEILRDVVLAGIQGADRVVVLTDKPNANVGFETGLAYGLGRQVALLAQRDPLPDWLREPPFVNFLVQPVDGANAIEAVLKHSGVWNRWDPRLTPEASDESSDSTLFLCPSRYEGQSLKRAQSRRFETWRTTPPFEFNLHDIPNLLRGVERLVWTIADFGEGADERDGAENAGNGVIAGWFFADVLNRHGGSLTPAALAELRQRFYVLRSQEARRVVDVELFEKPFADLSTFTTLLGEVASAPIRPMLPARTPKTDQGGSSHEREAISGVRALLNSRLSAGGVLDLASTLDGEGPITQAVASRVGNKGAMIDALLDALGPTRSLSLDFLAAAAALMPGSALAIQQLISASPPTTPTQGGPGALPNLQDGPRNTGRIFGAAHRLDRTAQWGQVLEGCLGENHCMFSLRGESRQGLGLFLERLNFYLTEKLKAQRVFNLPFKIEDECAESGSDWERRMSAVLARAKPGTAADHLNNIAREVSVFFVLGQGLGPLYNLNEVQERGLHEFLGKTFPDVLFASRASLPVHMLVPVDYDPGGEGLAERVAAAAMAGETYYNDLVNTAGRAKTSRRLLHYVKLKPVTFPTWEEVEAYLDNSRPHPTPETVGKIRADFEQIISEKSTTFDSLARRLDRHLGGT
ncbi:MAG: hypothetical protein EOO73_19535 [Myxococcales bacterium]|nr:MAG: hypothetical protein EOO73_19535 [Myxococcales bacterium]